MSHRHQIQGFRIPNTTTRRIIYYYITKADIKETKSARFLYQSRTE